MGNDPNVSQHPQPQSRSARRRGGGQAGFTLIELLIAIALISILAAVANIGYEPYYSQQLTSARGQLFADLQRCRVEAMTRSTGDNTRGFGVRFTDDRTYRVFEFDDYLPDNPAPDPDGDFTWTDASEEKAPRSQQLSELITVTRGDAGSIVNDVRLFDRRGLSRQATWGIAGITYVLRHRKVALARCVTVSEVQIREGNWDGSACK